MRFSVGLPCDRVDRTDEFVTGPAIMEMAAAAEAAGYDACYVTDHPAPDDAWLHGGGHHAPEPLVALAFAAAATTTLRLQTHVYIAAYRNPFLAAKGMGNLDALSGGRVILGVAAGYLRPEFGALGVDFDERNELLDESIAVMRRVWTEDAVAVEGRHFRARSVTVRPRPASPGGPPVWIGGNSNLALRRAVELGQGWVPFPNPPLATKALKTPAITSLADLEQRMQTVAEHSAAIGRTEPLDVCFAPFSYDDDFEPYAAMGVTWLAVQFDGVETRAGWIDRMRAFAGRRAAVEEGGVMELDLVMRTTGAARAFTDAPVHDATLARVLERARHAPSGGNRQPWRVVVVKDSELRRQIRDLCVLGWREYAAFVEAGQVPFGAQPDGRPARPTIDLDAARATPRPAAFVDDLDEVPAFLVIGAHLPSLAVLDWGLDRQSVVGGASVYPFVQNLLLAARDEGLGGVMTTFLCRQEDAARPLLGLAPDVGVAAVVALGVPDRFPEKLTRRPVEEFTTVDRFDGEVFP